ncbi:hypothetical protein DFP72DRAFT_12127 [Ephemerocybe angulata]|uniref:F-box domain-containing protein n=1 Tax=Ephemerocybe angulata TaxID=980116 RepID=A0A8H6IKC9_9AGAR|nr:hypothetical protein DFP72DRAFT_12127 [Tulosesus angulatus]
MEHDNANQAFTTFTALTKALLNDTESRPATRREKADQQVSELQKDIRTLKSYHNSTTASCRIPREILANILLAHQSLIIQGSRGSWRHEGIFLWIKTAHVCRHWRAVALDCPALWANLCSFTKREFVELSYRRSRNAPLAVDATRFHTAAVAATRRANGPTSYSIFFHSLNASALFNSILVRKAIRKGWTLRDCFRKPRAARLYSRSWF